MKSLVNAWVDKVGPRQDAKAVLWAKVYYHMRCGSVKHRMKYPLELLEEQQHLHGVHTEEADCLSVLRGPSSQEYQGALERLGKTADAQDPADVDYKRAVVNMLAQRDWDLGVPSGVTNTIEDFVWQKLYFVSAPASSHKHSIELMAQLFTEQYGESYFDNGFQQNPWVYFRVLIMCQKFETAIDYLMRKDAEHVVEAVHFAIAINHNGFLKTEEVLSKKQAGAYLSMDSKLLFSDVINAYVSGKASVVPGFANDHPKYAVHYYSLLRQTENKTELTHDGEAFFCNLILEARSDQDQINEQLVGDLHGGTRRLAWLDDALTKDQVKSLCEMAGKQAETNSQLTDAVALFCCAENFYKVFAIFNNQLGKFCAELPNQDPNRELWYQAANQFYERFIRSAANAAPDVVALVTPCPFCLEMFSLTRFV